jgi:dienelactone hydrolase
VSVHGLFVPPGNTAGNEIGAKVLALHGWSDPLAPPEQVSALAKELTAAGCDWQIHAFGHTLHAFTNPEAREPDNGFQFSESATNRSWKLIGGFLAELF